MTDIFTILEARDLESLSSHLKKEPRSANARGTCDKTPLHHSVQLHWNEAIDVLIQTGAKVNYTDDEGFSALDYASKSNNASAVKILLHNKASYNKERPLQIAFSRSFFSVCEELVLAGADVSELVGTTQYVGYVRRYRKEKCPLLKYAIKRRRDTLFLKLLPQYETSIVIHFLDISHRCCNHFAFNHIWKVVMADNPAALHYAVKYKDAEKVEDCIAKGDDVNYVYSKNQSGLGQIINPYRYEENYCESPIIEMLVKTCLPTSVFLQETFIKLINANAVIPNLSLCTYPASDYGWSILMVMMKAYNSGHKDCLDKMKNFLFAEKISLLHFAIMEQEDKLFKILLEAGATVCVEDAAKRTLLHYAVITRNMNAFETLMKKNIDMNAQDIFGKTALHYCFMKIDDGKDMILHNRQTDFQYLSWWHCDVKAMVDVLIQDADIYAVDLHKQSILHHAALGIHVEGLKILANHDMDMNIGDENGKLPIFLLFHNKSYSRRRSLSICFKMLAIKSNLLHTDNNGRTILHYIVEEHMEDLVHDAIWKGANINHHDINHKTPLHIAIEQKQMSVFEELIKHRASICIDKHGRGVLHLATIAHFPYAVERFVDLGLDLNHQDSSGVTPLQLASEKSESEMVELLLCLGASTEVSDHEGLTPLHKASTCSYYDNWRRKMEALLVAGANIDAVDNQGRTPLHLLAGSDSVKNRYYRHNSDINPDIELLVENITKQDHNGDSPLHTAAKNHNINILHQFILLGGDVHQQNNCGKSVIDFLSEGEKKYLDEWSDKSDCVFINSTNSKNAKSQKHALACGHSLKRAIEDNNNDLLKDILKESQMSSLEGLLHFTIEIDNNSAISILIENDIDVNAANERNETAIQYAIKLSRTNAFEILLHANADLRMPDGNGLQTLKYAIEAGNIQVLKKCLDKVNDTGQFLQHTNSLDLVTTAIGLLHFAIDIENNSAISILIEIGIDVNATNERNETAIQYAIKLNRINAFERLLHANADLRMPDGNGLQTLKYAIEAGNIQVLKKCLDKVNDTGQFLQHTNSLDLITTAIKSDNMDALRYFLGCGIHVNEIFQHRTLLHVAMQDHNVMACNMLLEAGADPTLPDGTGINTLQHALRTRNTHILRTLVQDSGINYNLNVDKLSNLIYNGMDMCMDEESRKLSNIKELLKIILQAVDVHERTVAGFTILHMSLLHFINLDFVDLLLEMELDVNDQDNVNNETPSHVIWQCRFNSMKIKVLKHMVSKGADLNLVDCKGWNMLHCAAYSNDAETINYLIESGLDVNKLTNDGTSAMMLCLANINTKNEKEKELSGIVSALIEAGAIIDHCNADGMTFLHFLASSESRLLPEVVDKVTSNTTNVNALNAKLETPLWLAVNGNICDHREYIFALIKAGAHMNGLCKCQKQKIFETAPINDIPLLQKIIGFGIELKYLHEYFDKLLFHSIYMDHSSNESVEDENLLLSWAIINKYYSTDSTVAFSFLMQQKLLDRAITMKTVELLKIVIEKGLNVNKQNQSKILNYAIFKQKHEHFDMLMENGVDIDFYDQYGFQPLHQAVHRKNIHALKALVARVRDVNAVTSELRNALHIAASGKNMSIIKYLIDCHVAINPQDEDGFTPAMIYLCCITGENKSDYSKDITVLEVMVSDANATSIALHGELLESPMFSLFRRRNLDVLRFIREKISNNVFQNLLNTILCSEPSVVDYFNDGSSEKTVELLLNLGVEVQSLSKWIQQNILVCSFSSLVTRRNTNNSSMCASLLENGLKFIGGRRVTVFFTTFVNYHNIESILQGGVGVNLCDHKGQTLLHHAVRAKNLRTVKTLISHGIDVNRVDRKNKSAMEILTQNDGQFEEKCFEIAHSIISANKNVDLSCDQLLQTAVHLSHEKMLKLLIENGVVVPRIDSCGRTPLHWCFLRDKHGWLNPNLSVVKLVLDAGVDPSMSDMDSKTALHYVVENNCDPIFINLLIKHGTDVNVQSNMNQTVMDLAICQYVETRWGWKSGSPLTALLQLGCKIADIDENLKIKLIEHAINERDVTVIDALLEDGLDINLEHSTGKTICEMLFDSSIYMYLDASISKYIASIANLVVEKNEKLLQINDYNLECLFNCILKSHDIALAERFIKILIENNKALCKYLHIAVREHDISVVQILLQKGVCINTIDVESGNSPLNDAVDTIYTMNYDGNDPMGMLNFLITKGADLTIEDGRGNSPLHNACSMNIQVLRQLLRTGVDVNLGSKVTALQIAVAQCNLDAVELLLDHRADLLKCDIEGRNVLHYAAIANTYTPEVLDLIMQEDLLEQRDHSGRTPLQTACLCKWPSMVKAFLKNSSNINIQNSDGHSLLHLAVKNEISNVRGSCTPSCFEKREDEIVSLLIKNGIDIEVEDNFGKTPLSFSASEHNFSASFILLSHEASPHNIKDDEKKFLLRQAILDQNIAAITRLLPASSSFDSDSKEAIALLRIHGELNTIKPALERGIAFDDNLQGTTALHQAVTKDTRTLTLLCQGKNLDVRDQHGITPLMAAIQMNCLHSAKVLVECGANPLVVDDYGRTILHLWSLIDSNSSRFKDEETLTWIIKQEIKLNVQDLHGHTALHSAVMQNQRLKSTLLVEKGADPLIRDKNNLTPLHFAVAMADMWDIFPLAAKEAIKVEPETQSMCFYHNREDLCNAKQIKSSSHNKPRYKKVEKIHVSVKKTSPQMKFDLFDVLANQMEDFAAHKHHIFMTEHFLCNVPRNWLNEMTLSVNTIISLLQDVSQKMKEEDCTMEFLPIISGSCKEGTKVGDPDEADVLCLLTNLSPYFKLIDKKMNYGTFVELECIDPEQECVKDIVSLYHSGQYDENGKKYLYYLDREKCLNRFFLLFNKVMKRKDIWQKHNLLYRVNPHGIMLPVNKIQKMDLIWHGSLFKLLPIDVDIVPALMHGVDLSCLKNSNMDSIRNEVECQSDDVRDIENKSKIESTESVVEGLILNNPTSASAEPSIAECQGNDKHQSVVQEIDKTANKHYIASYVYNPSVNQPLIQKLIARCGTLFVLKWSPDLIPDPKKHRFNGASTVDDRSSLQVKKCYSWSEAELLRVLPAEMKQGYMLAKAIQAVVPIVDSIPISTVITSYMLKTCILYEFTNLKNFPIILKKLISTDFEPKRNPFEQVQIQPTEQVLKWARAIFKRIRESYQLYEVMDSSRDVLQGTNNQYRSLYAEYCYQLLSEYKIDELRYHWRNKTFNLGYICGEIQNEPTLSKKLDMVNEEKTYSDGYCPNCPLQKYRFLQNI